MPDDQQTPAADATEPTTAAAAGATDAGATESPAATTESESAPATTTTEPGPAPAPKRASAAVNPYADDRVALVWQGPGSVGFLPKGNVTVADLWARGITQARADALSGPGKPYRRTVAYPADLPTAPAERKG